MGGRADLRLDCQVPPSHHPLRATRRHPQSAHNPRLRRHLPQTAQTVLSLTLIDAPCRELKGQRAGRLTIEDGKILAQLYAFDRDASWGRVEGALKLILNTGEIATLLNCITTRLGSAATMRRSVGILDTEADLALIGEREWSDEDRVTKIEFCLPDARGTLSYGAHLEHGFRDDGDNFITSTEFHAGKAKIFCFDLEDVTISLSKSPSIAVKFFEQLGDDPTFITVSWREACPLAAAFQIPFHIEILCSLSEGRPIRQSGQSIQTATEEASRRDGSAGYRCDYSLLRSWRPSEFAGPRERFVDPLLRMYLPEERDVCRSVFRAWLKRRHEWRTTYWLASQFVHAGNLYDRGRLLKAMAWFESIPDYQSNSGVSDNALKKFRRDARALDSFNDLGVDERRLTQLLNELK